MKRTFIIFALIASMSLPAVAAAQQNTYLQASALALNTFDNTFASAYGSWHFVPEVTAARRLIKSLYVYAGYAWLHSSQVIPDTGDTAAINWHMLRLGVEYRLKLNNAISWSLRVGGVETYAIESLAGDSSGSWIIGFESGTAIFYQLHEKIFVGLEASYIYGRKTLAEHIVQPGGMCIGLIIGKYL